MLLWLTEYLAQDIRAFNVFNYITLRTVLATMTALMISFVIGPKMINWLARMKIGQAVRHDGPQTHLVKSGTPTMGGALILVAIIITSLLWSDLDNRFVWAVLFVIVGFGAIGWVDDYRKVVYRNPKGLSAKSKYFWQSFLAVFVALYLALAISAPGNMAFWTLMANLFHGEVYWSLSNDAHLIVPFFKTITYPLGVFGFVVLTYFVIVGTSNAVNLTDGLDGLAIMPTVMIAAALGVFAYVMGNSIFAKYLQFPFIIGTGELTVICGAIAGAGLGFFVVHPLPRRCVYGRCRCAGARRGAGNHCCGGSSGNRIIYHGRCFRCRNPVGHGTSNFIQADRETNIPDGADSSSFRIERLERKPGCRTFLDHYDTSGAGRSFHIEIALTGWP